LVHQIRDLVKSEQSEWESDTNFAADLQEFIGEANTREMGNRIRERIISRIVNIGLVPRSDLEVRVVPVHINQLACFIKVSCSPTPMNKLVLGESIVVTFVYDTIEHSAYFMLSDTSQKELFLNG
jgi:hypothetical protein